MRQSSPLIVGGGPAGSAAAIMLACAGLRPLILERSATPQDALCGGFLSWTTIRRLRALGIDVAALGAHPISRIALFAGRSVAEAALPAPACALSRRALDSALLDAATAAGAGVQRGVSAKAVDGRALRLDDGTTLAPAHLILATGKHELRGAIRPFSEADPAIGLRWTFRPSRAMADVLTGTVEIHLLRGGYAGLSMQEDGVANLCLTVRRSRFSAAGNPAKLLEDLCAESSFLAARMAGAELVSHPQGIANIPYGWIAFEENLLYRVGDQIGVIPSLAGEGVGIALASGVAAAGSILAGKTPALYTADMRRRLRRPIGQARLIALAGQRPALAAGLVAIARHVPAAVTAMASALRLTDGWPWRDQPAGLVGAGPSPPPRAT